MVLRALQLQQLINPATGELVVTVAGHGFTTSDKIRIEDNSLTFTCSKDGNHENKTYSLVPQILSLKMVTSFCSYHKYLYG